MPKELAGGMGEAYSISGAELQQLKLETESNDKLNELCRRQINHIFELTNQLQVNHDNDDVQLNEIHKDIHEDIPTISIDMVKNLTVQLNKLRAIDINNHLNSINKSIRNMERKIGQLETECLLVKQKIEHSEQKGKAQYRALLTQVEKQSNKYQNDIDDLIVNKISNINRQSNKFESYNFKVLKQIAFSRDKSNNLKVFNLSILKLDEFLNYNLIDINQFLEGLIKFQNYLQGLFDINLPYLADLQNCLPNSKFYDLIQQKTNLMLGKEAIDEKNNGEFDQDKNENINQEFLISPEPIDKIVKLGKILKLPLSAKTRNMQRRFSKIQSPEIEIPIMKEQSLSPPSSNTTTRDNGSINVNKKLIIIPHKILNKPFNKLSIKEFLNFLIVIVKIIVNFDVFLTLVDGDGGYNNRSNESFEFICDFNQILNKINGLSLEKQSQSKKNPNLLNFKLKLKDLTETVYKLIIHGNSKSFKSPTLLKDLNFSDLIENQNKKQQVGDWDMVSKMF